MKFPPAAIISNYEGDCEIEALVMMKLFLECFEKDKYMALIYVLSQILIGNDRIIRPEDAPLLYAYELRFILQT